MTYTKHLRTVCFKCHADLVNEADTKKSISCRRNGSGCGARFCSRECYNQFGASDAAAHAEMCDRVRGAVLLKKRADHEFLLDFVADSADGQVSADNDGVLATLYACDVAPRAALCERLCVAGLYMHELGMPMRLVRALANTALGLLPKSIVAVRASCLFALTLGESRAATERFAEARHALERLDVDEPIHDATVRYLIGQHLHELRSPASIGYLVEASETFKSFGHHKRVLQCAEMAGDALFDVCQHGRAIEEWTDALCAMRILGGCPHNPSSIREKIAIARRQVGELDTAVELLHESLAVFRSGANCHNADEAARTHALLVEIEAERNNVSEALKHAELAVAMYKRLNASTSAFATPNAWRVQVTVSKLLVKERHYERALATAREALAGMPTSKDLLREAAGDAVDLHEAMSAALAGLGNVDEAHKALERGLVFAKVYQGSHASLCTAHTLVAVSHARAGRTAEAMAAFGEAHKHIGASQHSERVLKVYTAKAELLMLMMQRPDDALATIDQALTLAQSCRCNQSMFDESYVHVVKGSLLNAHGKFELALEELNKADEIMADLCGTVISERADFSTLSGQVEQMVERTADREERATAPPQPRAERLMPTPWLVPTSAELDAARIGAAQVRLPGRCALNAAAALHSARAIVRDTSVRDTVAGFRMLHLIGHALDDALDHGDFNHHWLTVEMALVEENGSSVAQSLGRALSAKINAVRDREEMLRLFTFTPSELDHMRWQSAVLASADGADAELRASLARGLWARIFEQLSAQLERLDAAFRAFVGRVAPSAAASKAALRFPRGADRAAWRADVLSQLGCDASVIAGGASFAALFPSVAAKAWTSLEQSQNWALGDLGWLDQLVAAVAQRPAAPDEAALREWWAQPFISSLDELMPLSITLGGETLRLGGVAFVEQVTGNFTETIESLH